jgi:two-component system, OmpR family, response regulator
MAQAKRVLSTPPTNTPIDTTRRRLLSVAALASMARTTDATVLRVGPLELDPINRTATRGDRLLHLLPREFRLLEYMMQRPGQHLTRATFLKEVWHYKFIPETTILVDVHMGKLRRKVDGPNEVQMIGTVRGVGFILRAVQS